MKPTIVLLTDFGLQDPYVGIVKGVLLSCNPELTLVDLSHDVGAFQIDIAAFILRNSLQYFPPGSIFLVVVDPGVGSSRKALFVKVGDYYFVGPDNGVLYPAVQKLGDELQNGEKFQVFVIEETKIEQLCKEFRILFSPSISSTFHGRDIFAPTAALLAMAYKPEDLGHNYATMQSISLEPLIGEDSFSIQGKILQIDRFGNLITNISFEQVRSLIHRRRIMRKKYDLEIVYKSITFRSIQDTFSSVGKGEILAYWGSFSFLELGMNQSNLAMKISAQLGDGINLHLR